MLAEHIRPLSSIVYRLVISSSRGSSYDFDRLIPHCKMIETPNLFPGSDYSDIRAAA